MKPIRVAFPLGIGDCHWPCQKIAGLSKMFGHAPIHAYVARSPNHNSVGYLELMPCIEKAEFSENALTRIRFQMPPDYRDERWRTLEGSAGWNGFDYLFCANGHIEEGKPIADWMPELETQYEFDYVIDAQSQSDSRRLMPYPEVLLYMSSLSANVGFHKMWWRLEDWVEVIRLFNGRGIVPTMVGANTEGDLNYNNMIAQERPAIEFKSIVGRTTIPTMVDLLKRCRVWMGLNSGFGIVSASMGTPTVMFWSDDRWPLVREEWLLKEAEQRAWLRYDQLEVYRTFSYGSPDMTPEAVVSKAMEIMR